MESSLTSVFRSPRSSRLSFLMKRTVIFLGQSPLSCPGVRSFCPIYSNPNLSPPGVKRPVSFQLKACPLAVANPQRARENLNLLSVFLREKHRCCGAELSVAPKIMGIFPFATCPWSPQRTRGQSHRPLQISSSFWPIASYRERASSLRTVPER